MRRSAVAVLVTARSFSCRSCSDAARGSRRWACSTSGCRRWRSSGCAATSRYGFLAVLFIFAVVVVDRHRRLRRRPRDRRAEAVAARLAQQDLGGPDRRRSPRARSRRARLRSCSRAPSPLRLALHRPRAGLRGAGRRPRRIGVEAPVRPQGRERPHPRPRRLHGPHGRHRRGGRRRRADRARRSIRTRRRARFCSASDVTAIRTAGDRARLPTCLRRPARQQARRRRASA